MVGQQRRQMSPRLPRRHGKGEVRANVVQGRICGSQQGPGPGRSEGYVESRGLEEGHEASEASVCGQGGDEVRLG